MNNKLYVFLGTYCELIDYAILEKKYYKSDISVSNSEFERMLFQGESYSYNMTLQERFIRAKRALFDKIYASLNREQREAGRLHVRNQGGYGRQARWRHPFG